MRSSRAKAARWLFVFVLLGGVLLPWRALVQDTLDTALALAVYTGDWEKASLLVGWGADPGARDAEGTPLSHYAAASTGSAQLSFLLSAGADPNAADEAGKTPLHAAAEMGNLEAVRLLLFHGAHVTAVTHNGHSALAYAVWGRHYEMAKILLMQASPTEPRDLALDSTPLLDAIGNRDEAMVGLLLAHGGNLNASDRFGWYPITKAAFLGSLPLVKMLVAAGADVRLKDKDGWEASHFAVGRRGAGELLPFLIENGADVDAATHEGFTLLMRAAQTGDEQAAGYLLERNADVNRVNWYGFSALSLALIYGQTGLAARLEAMGARYEPPRKIFLLR